MPSSGLDRWVRAEASAAWGALTPAAQQNGQSVLALIELDVPLRQHMGQDLPVTTSDLRHTDWRATYQQRNRELIADALVLWIEDQTNSDAARSSALLALIALVALETKGDVDPGLKWIGGPGMTPGKRLPAYVRFPKVMEKRDPPRRLPTHLDARTTTARQALLALCGGHGVTPLAAELGTQLASLELRLPEDESTILKLLREVKAATKQVVRVHGGPVPTWERLSDNSLCLALPQRALRVVGADSAESAPIRSPAAGERLVLVFEASRDSGRKQLLTWEELGLTKAYDHPHTAPERALRALRSEESPQGEDWSDLNEFLSVTKKGVRFRQTWYEVESPQERSR